MKQAVFENVQELDSLKSSNILKACTTQWLIHGDTSVHVIHCFKQVLTTLNTLVTKKDKETKGIRDQLLAANSSMMLLLLGDVQVLISNIFSFPSNKKFKLQFDYLEISPSCMQTTEN